MQRHALNNKETRGNKALQRRQLILAEESYITPSIQPQLEVGASSDQYEQQADAVAEKVVHQQTNTAPILPISQNMLQGKSEDGFLVSNQLKSKLSNEHGGQSLPKHVAQGMGQQIGADFSNVRIHTDSTAVQMNRDLGAKAFTHGKDIYFNEGNYNPTSTDGKRLLAHELTHTVQQGASGKKIQRNKDDEKEKYPIVYDDARHFNKSSWYKNAARYINLLQHKKTTPINKPNAYANGIYEIQTALKKYFKEKFKGTANGMLDGTTYLKIKELATGELTQEQRTGLAAAGLDLGVVDELKKRLNAKTGNPPLLSSYFRSHAYFHLINSNPRFKLQRGDQLDAVLILQRGLLELNYRLPKYKDDGSYGKETEKAIKAFQRDSGLPDEQVDGIVGQQTLRLLDRRFSTKVMQRKTHQKGSGTQTLLVRYVPINKYLTQSEFTIVALVDVFQISVQEAKALVKEGWKIRGYTEITKHHIDARQKKVMIRPKEFEKIQSRFKKEPGTKEVPSQEGPMKEQVLAFKKRSKLYALKKLLALLKQQQENTKDPTKRAALKKRIEELQKAIQAEFKKLGLTEEQLKKDETTFKKTFGAFALETAHKMLDQNERTANIEQLRFQTDKKTTNGQALKKLFNELDPLYNKADRLWWKGLSTEITIDGNPDKVSTPAEVNALGYHQLTPELGQIKLYLPRTTTTMWDYLQLYEKYRTKRHKSNAYFQQCHDAEKLGVLKVMNMAKEYPILLSSKLKIRKNIKAYIHLSAADIEKKMLGVAQSVIENIKKTRKTINKENVWELKPVIYKAKQELGIVKGSREDELINAAIKKHSSNKLWRNIALAALGIGLGLLALMSGPVGWLALAGSIGVGIYDAQLTFNETSFMRAAANSAIDPNRALSKVNPSWFWFALSLVGIGIDVVAVAKLLKAAKLAKLNQAKAVDLIAETTRTLETEIRTLQKAIKAGTAPSGSAAKLASLQDARIKLNDGVFKEQIDLLLKVKDHPVILTNLADAFRDQHIGKAFIKLKALGLADESYLKLLQFYGGVGKDFIGEIPELMRVMKKSGLLENKALLEDVLINPNLQRVVLDHADDPGVLMREWTKWGKTAKSVSFEQFLKNSGYNTKAAKGTKLFEQFGADFAKLPAKAKNQQLLRTFEPRLAHALDSKMLPPAIQKAVKKLLKSDMIGNTQQAEIAIFRLRKQLGTAMGKQLDTMDDYAKVSSFLTDKTMLSAFWKATSHLKGHDEFSKLMTKYSQQITPEIMNDLKRIGPINDETIQWLLTNPALRKTYAKYPEALAVLKKCASPCLPKFATARQIEEIHDIVSKAGLDNYGYSIINEYFYRTRHSEQLFLKAIEEIKSIDNLKEWVKGRYWNKVMDKIKAIADNYPWPDVKASFSTETGLMKKLAEIARNSGMSPRQLEAILLNLKQRESIADALLTMKGRNINTVEGKVRGSLKSMGSKLGNQNSMIGRLVNGLMSKDLDELKAALAILDYLIPARGGYASRANAILEAFPMNELARLRGLAGDAFNPDDIYLLITRIDGNRDLMWRLINKAGANATDTVIDPDIPRLCAALRQLGDGKHSEATILATLTRNRQFEQALRSAGSGLGDTLWGFKKTGTGQRVLTDAFRAGDKQVSGSLVLSYFKGKANEIATTVVKADGSIDWTQWRLIKAAVEDADMATIIKNKTIGEVLWPKIKLLQFRRLNNDVANVVEEVSIRIKGTDTVARIDAVIVKNDGTILFKEFKTGNAGLSNAQSRIYEIMRQGDPQKQLEPFGAKAKMVWGDPPTTNFQPRAVDVVTDTPPAAAASGSSSPATTK